MPIVVILLLGNFLVVTDKFKLKRVQRHESLVKRLQ